jgi:hypothetical protein
MLASAVMLAQVEGYQRREGGKLEEVRGYAVHKMLGMPQERYHAPLYAYSHNDFYTLNRRLRGLPQDPEDDVPGLGDKLDSLQAGLDSAFGAAAPAPRPFVVYRNPSFTGGGGKELQEIHVPAGSKAASILNVRSARYGGKPSWDNTRWDEDKEVLLNRGSVLRDVKTGETFTDAAYLSTSSDPKATVLASVWHAPVHELELLLPGDDVSVR